MQILTAKTDTELITKIESYYQYEDRFLESRGLEIQKDKTEIMIVKSDIKNLKLAEKDVKISSNLKFLGYCLDRKLKQKLHIEYLNERIRKIAGRIRSFKLFSTEQRKKLYIAWVQGLLLSNSLAYLPFLKINENRRLQTACNFAIRAVIMKTRRNRLSMKMQRQNLGLMSIKQLRKYIIWTECVKKKSLFLTELGNQSGPNTRAMKKGKLRHGVMDNLGSIFKKTSKDAFSKIGNPSLSLEYKYLHSRIKRTPKQSSSI